MGSSGSGSFTDYSNHKPSNGTGDSGGASGSDNCLIAFSTSIEEVSRSQYYQAHTNVPPVDTEVKLNFNGFRISVLTLSDEEIGYLPTRYNYLRTCMASGYNYYGRVIGSSILPTPNVKIDVVPE